MKNTWSFCLTVAAAVSLAGSASAQTGRYTNRLGIKPPAIAVGTTEGKMDNKPYSASYLPRSSGPLAKEHDTEIQDMIEKGFGDCDLVHQIVKDNAKKASSEKFDTAVKNGEGTDPGLTDSYKREGFDEHAEGWEGFCHQWSPAGLDPASAFIVSMDKIYANVPFGIGDLRELTTWTYSDSDSIFIGKRNYSTDAKPEADELDPMDLLSTFSNYVGHDKPGVVLDIDPGRMVWNQPFYSYKTETTELTGDAANGGGDKAKKAYQIKLGATYASEGGFAYRGDTYTRDLNWTMKVWTDEKGKVVKSEWVRDQSDRIPDFAWVPNVKTHNANYERLEKIAKDGISVKDIESFCKGMQALTKDSLAADGKKLADLLNNICPVLDQNKLAAYEKATAERTGIDFSVLDSTLNPDVPNG